MDGSMESDQPTERVKIKKIETHHLALYWLLKKDPFIMIIPT